jgi:hypothetical protein
MSILDVSIPWIFILWSLVFLIWIIDMFMGDK